MKLVKLHTTTSTNMYLKECLSKANLEDFTVAIAHEQTQGRGQRGNSWHSKAGKNLTFSIFTRLKDFSVSRQFELNQVVSLAIVNVLNQYLSNVQIKWPNDIMAENHKIAGILIENTVSKSAIKHSIIGIGLNVNQTHFPKRLTHAISLKNILKKKTNLDILLAEILDSIQKQFKMLYDNPKEVLDTAYIKQLYQWQKEAHYMDKNQQKFIGKIIGVSEDGKLQIQLKNQTLRTFFFKEISFI